MEPSIRIKSYKEALLGGSDNLQKKSAGRKPKKQNVFKGNKNKNGEIYVPPRLQNKMTKDGFQNVCFGNAAIQALLSVKIFRTFLMENNTKRHNYPIQERIVRYLCTLITTKDEN